jgi:hypothetical protein
MPGAYPRVEHPNGIFLKLKVCSQVDPVTQARLEALLETAGIGKISGESKPLADPEVFKKFSYFTKRSSVSASRNQHSKFAEILKFFGIKQTSLLISCQIIKENGVLLV